MSGGSHTPSQPKVELPAPLAAARSIVAGLIDPAILYDARLAPLFFNAHYARMSGQRPRRLWRLIRSGTLPFEYCGEADEDERAQLGEVVSAGRPVTLPEVRVRALDGTEAVVMPSFIPVLDEGERGVGVISSFRDVSAEARVHARYKELIAVEKARAEDLERQVADRTRQLTAALEEVTRLSKVDPLTQTINRRAFYEQAERALELARRHDRCAAVLMCDLDYFKEVNDTFGHQAGDTVLERVARALEACLRGTDLVGRFGGEEFVVLLTETHPDHLAKVAERCLEAVRAIPVAELIPGMRGPQTLSVGAAVFPDDGDDLDALMRGADGALYAAKANGRDRAILCADAAGEEGAGEGGVQMGDEAPSVLVVGTGAQRRDEYVRELSGRYSVFYAASVDDALQQVRERPFDSIVAEEALPEGSGVDFLRQTLAHAPEATRILALPTREWLFTLQGVSAAHVDEFVQSADGPGTLAKAIDDAKLSRTLAREEFWDGPGMITGVHEGHLAALETSLSRGELEVALLPIADTAAGAIAGYELVATSASAMVVEPAGAIYRAALRAGRIWELGRMVRRRAAEAADSLPPGARLFVSLHPGEMGDPELAGAGCPLAARLDRVVVQMTARATVPDARAFLRGLRALREVGFELAITDFGGGSASLGAAESLAPDYIKVRGDLIRGFSASTARRSLVENLIAYCRDQRIVPAATSIDTEPDHELAKDVGFRLLQGDRIGDRL